MKIISKLKDYYDSGQQFGVDDSLVFVRDMTLGTVYCENHTLKMDKVWLPISLIKSSDVYHYFDYEPFIIWFCGKTYLTYRITEHNEFSVKVSYLYGDLMVKRIKELHTTLHKGKYLSKSIFNDLEKQSFNIHNIHEIAKDHKSPYFVIGNFGKDYWSKTTEANFEVLPRLRDFHFYNVLHATQAYQEIEMYLPRFKEDPIPLMTDAQKIASHGLDETSFRCEAPGNKKSRRKENKQKKRNSKWNS